MTLLEPSPIAAIRNPDCTLCPLHESAQTICMMGTGPLDARVMVVGEAPGFNEDREGRPFIGAAGQLLDRELERVGLRREDVFVTNSQRCRPPQNRKPTATERKACKPYLNAEVELVKPDLIITMGNSAMQSVLGTSGITSKMNALYEKDGNQVLPVLHPAAVLRDPTHMDAFRAGLLLAKRVLDDTNEPPETKVTIVNDERTLAMFVGAINEVQDPIAIDIETATTTDRDGGGLEAWAPDFRLDTISFTWREGESWVLPCEHPESEIAAHGLYDGLNKLLDGKRLVGHNIKFDLLGLRWRGVKARAHFDTMVAAHLLDENRASKGLKALARQYLGAGAYEDAVKRDGTDTLDTLAHYNGQDTDYTLRLYHLFREELLQPGNEKLLRIFMLLSMPAVNALTDIETRGFPVDLRRLKTRHEQINEKLTELQVQMIKYVPREDRKEANWNRSNFLTKFLFETLELPIVDVTPTNLPSMNEDSLLEIADQHPIVPLLLEYRKWKKWESTYTRPWIERIKVAQVPRLYPNYNVTGTVTGRLSSNFQQVPRDNFIRGIIGARKGMTLIEADFSQIELRIAAMVSGDETMMGVYRDGGDIHMNMATAITGKPAEEVTKEERSRAKPVNFGFLYGMGSTNYVPYARANYGIEVTEAQAQHYRATFFLTYPRLVDWHDRQRRVVHGMGYVESPIGRRRRLPAVRSTDKDKAAEAERQAINSPVQGFASDLTVLAMTLLEHDEILMKSECTILGQVHDSILFELPDDPGSVEDATTEIKYVMEHLPIRRLFGYQPSVPIVADVKIHKHWGGE